MIQGVLKGMESNRKEDYCVLSSQSNSLCSGGLSFKSSTDVQLY